MQIPDDPIDAKPDRLGQSPEEPTQGPTGALQPRTPQPNFAYWLELIKRWLANLKIPAPVTLGAFVAAAFLVFPAIKGLTSGSAIRELELKNQEQEQRLATVNSRNAQLEREVSERDIRLSQRQQAGRSTNDSGLYVSPLLFLERKKSTTPDLINIDFSQADQAILVFSLPRLDLRDIEISIYQDTQLVWNQSIAVPKEKLFSENLVTFLLTRSALRAGTYRITVEGNPTARRIGLNQFDLAIRG
jgi:hypothetical protein